MLLPPEVKYEAESLLSSREGNRQKILRVEPIGGGNINYSLKLVTGNGSYFLKWNYTKKFPLIFNAEVKGLELLHAVNRIHIPRTIAHKEVGIFAFLLLEFIEAGPPSVGFYEDFGKNLAQIHRNSAKQFGLDHNNYIGSLPQSNKQHDSWTDFFISERIEHQLKLARDKNSISKEPAKHFDRLYNVLNEIFPPEPPSLLHGDLWSGNFLRNRHGKAALIDPAVYYGSREMDIAMSKLFGGFDEAFYEGYNSEWALEKGWEKRMDICNLYPLLVHVNIFGGNYVQQVLNIVKKF